jgi:acetyltransferase-like isoleucine patch superfamily enzyme
MSDLRRLPSGHLPVDVLEGSVLCSRSLDVTATYSMSDSADIASELGAAEAHRQAGRLAEARRVLQELLVRHPLQPRAFHLLGLVLHGFEQNDDALALLRLSVELEPGSSSFQNNLGAVLGQMGRNGEAVAAFARALKLNPQSTEARANLAAALQRLPVGSARPSQSGRLIHIGPHALICCGPRNRIRIGRHVHLPAEGEDPALLNTFAGRVEIGDWCLIGYGLQIHTGTHNPDAIERARHSGPGAGHDVVLGRGVWTGARVTILGPARIGDHAVIGACSLVRTDVPAAELWAGNPARFIRKLTPTHPSDSIA